MEPTPVMTVHARSADVRSGRRAGVGRAPAGFVGVLIVALVVALALLPTAALAAKPSGLPNDPAASSTLPPGQEKKQTPVPAPTPAPATTLPVAVPTVAPTAAPATMVITPAPVPTDPGVASPTDPSATGGQAGSVGGGTTGSGGSTGDQGNPVGGVPTADPSAAPSDASASQAADGSAGSGSTGEGGQSGGPSSAASVLPIAVGGGIVAGLVGGIMLVLVARRRQEPEPVAMEAAIPEPVDHERLLAEALGARTGRHAVLVGDDRRPAWLRRLEPTAGRPVFHDPDVDDTI